MKHFFDNKTKTVFAFEADGSQDNLITGTMSPIPESDIHLYLDANVTKEENAIRIRAQRDMRLLQCDWTQLADIPATIKEAWIPYRQALRDIAEQPTFPDSVTWPVAPN